MRCALIIPRYLTLGVFLLVHCQEKEEQPVDSSFQLNPDFQLELVAAEPLVFDPVDLEFDENGDAYVLEMPGYPMDDAESRLVQLHDDDDDGLYDRRTVFADSLHIASSFMPYQRGFLVLAPPELLWVGDSDGDGIADVRKPIMGGFERGNQQHNSNGLTFGLDNWIYAANGGNDGNPYFVEHPDHVLDLRGQDFRFRIDSSQLERVGESSGGFGLAFDQWGNQFETHNLKHISQLIFPGKFIEDIPVVPRHSLFNISDHEENGLSRIYPIGEQETRVNHPEQSGYFSGACGITFYGGNAYPEPFNNQIFVADVVLNLIHLDLLSPNGSAMKASRHEQKKEFLASTDRSFRPVNMATGPDGALYVVDMHRAVIEHPEWIPDELEATMDLNAGKNQGRIYRINPKTTGQSEMTTQDRGDPAALAKALSHPNQWVRNTAQRLLIEEANPTSIELVKAKIQATDPLATVHALWILDGLNNLDPGLLTQVLIDHEANVRVNALKIIAEKPSFYGDLVPQVLACTQHPDARVRLLALLTLSSFPAAIKAAHWDQITTNLVKLLERRQTDTWQVMALASVARLDPVSCIQVILNSRILLTDTVVSVLQTLGRMVGKTGNQAAIQTVLQILPSTRTSATPMLQALADGLEQANDPLRGQPAVPVLLSQLERSHDPAIVLAGARIRKYLKLPASMAFKQLLHESGEKIANQTLPLAERIEWLQLMEMAPFSQRATYLYSLLDPREPLELQTEVLGQLWRSNDMGVPKELIARWGGLSPQIKAAAGNILLYKSGYQRALLTALENKTIQMGEMNFDLERRRTLLWWSEDPEVKKRAESLFSDAGVVTRKQAMDQMQVALTLPGNAANGQQLFLNLCSQCHQYSDLGVAVGPVLTEINRKSKASLMHDILDPNAAVNTQYINHRIRTKDGSIYTGIVEKEDDRQVVLKNMGGQEQIISKKDIDQFSSMGTSLMPEGLEASMQPGDLADLLAFLQRGEIH